ncbi:MAG: AAA family ATPase [Saprospiraceae bacterium]|nr:AAA family ATPase [Saprospiraceae bacterium]
MPQTLRPHAEVLFKTELDALVQSDKDPRPENWLMSPQSVVTYLLGGKAKDGTVITPKYFGQKRLMEVAVATLATDRALLLAGVPGTAKTWVSEHLAAAISGDSTLLVQGTAGISEDALRYGWNYARLLAEGPSEKSLVASPVMKAMLSGKLIRVEELTRMPSDVQDSLITLLSEKVLPVPELNLEIAAIKGFNLIATANTRDKGVHELSAALRRRFNTVMLPLPASLEEEVEIVKNRVAELGSSLSLSAKVAPLEEIRRLVLIFRELRSGETSDGSMKLKSPSSTLSAAEAISVITSGQALATYFGNGKISAADLAAGLTGAIIKDPSRDLQVWQEYLETVVRSRKDWKDLYKACKEVL